ncbi:MAG: MarR family transcriptional regulator [Bacteroidales bacterium]|nr:MarR family transcriptional regulator [Bacteroidales bacterium]
MADERLKLENQLCFPVYAASRLITREYQPFLDSLGITYPQYLVLMILWEQDNMPVNDIARKLILNTNTITPLLKRMEKQGILMRERSMKDERKVMIRLTEVGRNLQNEAIKIPEQLAAKLLQGPLSIGELIRLKDDLGVIIEMLTRSGS